GIRYWSVTGVQTCALPISGNLAFQSGVWDPLAGTFSTFGGSWDMFCNGITVMADGRPLIAGGTLQYDPFRGARNAALFDPSTSRSEERRVGKACRSRWERG